MSKIKVVLLGLFAVFAVSAGTAATASATHVFKVEATELGSGAIPVTEAIEADSFSGKMETTISGLSISVQCEEDVSGASEIKKNGESKGVIEFKSCFVLEKSKTGTRVFITACEVGEAVKAKFNDVLTEHSIDEYKGSGEEEVFVELSLKGSSCAIKGTYKVKGSQVCATPEAEFEKVIHESICTPAGSKLKQKGEPTENTAQLFGVEQLKLKSGKPWSAN
jgi:hypothetical protein